jgi:hypothetical protein
MGDAPVAYVEGAGGTRVAEDQIVAVGKNDVTAASNLSHSPGSLTHYRFCPSKWDDNRSHSRMTEMPVKRLPECVLMIFRWKAQFLRMVQPQCKLVIH